MKLIGKGWQYRVYDIGGGRVRKIKRNPIDSFCRIFFTPKVFEKYRRFRFNPILSYREMSRIHRESDYNIHKFKEILPRIPSYLVGNPVFLGGINYEQDYAAPIGEYFIEHTNTENKAVITGFAYLIVELWKYGCADTVFNFTINNAIDAAGRIIQIDIGEFIFDKELVRQEISSKKWLEQAAYIFLENKDLKEFYRSEMDHIVTLEALENNWRKNLLT